MGHPHSPYPKRSMAERDLEGPLTQTGGQQATYAASLACGILDVIVITLNPRVLLTLGAPKDEQKSSEETGSGGPRL